MEGKEPGKIATDVALLIGVLENVNVSLTRYLINQVEQCKLQLNKYKKLYEEMKCFFNEVHHESLMEWE